jgi:methylmalonyl-CoA mutase N-terminal domain/subunit
VGVNKFATDEHEVSDTQEIDKTAIREQLDRLSEMKEKRNKNEVQKSLANLKETAAGDGNLMPLIIRAVITHATLGEISDTLRSVFGEY